MYEREGERRGEGERERGVGRGRELGERARICIQLVSQEGQTGSA